MRSELFTGLPRKLREIYCAPTVQIIFVAILSLSSTRHEERLGGDSILWLKTVACKISPDSAAYYFDHGIIADDEFGWKDLFKAGGLLLEALIQLEQYEELRGRPIILLGHSLGGVVLKRALRLAHHQGSPFRSLRSNIAGVVLFGTPHSQVDMMRSWQNATLVLKCHSKNKVKEIIESDILSELAEDCRCFQTAFDHVPVFSAYETQQTRLPHKFGHSKAILVGKESARTNMRKERLEPLEADHTRMCHMLGDCQGASRVEPFIRSAFKEAVDLRQAGRQEGLRQSLTSPGSPQYFVSPKNLGSSMGSDSGFGSMTASSSFGSVGLFSEQQAERTDPKIPSCLMPLARNRGFFGREDVLKEVEEALLPRFNSNSAKDWHSISHPRSYVLCGLGGMGKTQIAAEYIYSRKDRYDAIFWVQADEYAKLAQGFYHIAIHLGLVAENSADARDHVITREAVKNWLKNPVKTYRPTSSHEAELATWLLVFDNADETDILGDFWPHDSCGAVLITTHDPLTKSDVASGGSVLEAFNAEESTDFLLKLTNREAEIEERAPGTAVAKMLGGLPLALTQMAGVIERRDLSFSEFLQVYDEESTHKDLFNVPIRLTKNRSGYQHTLASVWAVETLSESAALLDVLSLLDSDGIQERILEAHREHVVLSGYPKTNAAYQIARTELLRCSLITRDRGAKKLTMHRLIQDAARTKMTPERFNDVFRATVSLLSAIWPFEEFDWRHGVASRIQCEDLFPHVIRLRKLFKEFVSSTSVSESDLEFPRLLTDAGWFSHERGNTPESGPFFNMAQEICESLQTRLRETQQQDERLKDLSQELDFILGKIHYNNGCIATETNEPKLALEHFAALNKIMLKQFGPLGSDLKLAISWNELGNGLMMNKRWEEATGCFQSSIDTLRRQPDFTRTSMSFPLVNLGFVYWILDRLDDADKVCAEALQDRRINFGVDDPESFVTGKLLHIYGNVRAAQGRMEESFEFHNRALLQYKKFTVGKNHHRTADVCIKVADHYVRAKEYQGARTLLDQALKIYGDSECYVPERARTNFKKAKLLLGMGQSEKAETYFTEAMDLYHHLKPGDKRSLKDLRDADFDEILTFWSR